LTAETLLIHGFSPSVPRAYPFVRSGYVARLGARRALMAQNLMCAVGSFLRCVHSLL